MELDVGRARVLVGVPEAAGLEEARGDRAALGQQILESRERGPVWLGVAVVGMRAGDLADRVEVEVVLEVGAD